jgi:hypothetical protein
MINILPALMLTGVEVLFAVALRTLGADGKDALTGALTTYGLVPTDVDEYRVLEIALVNGKLFEAHHG